MKPHRGVVPRFNAAADTYDEAAEIQARIAQRVAALIGPGDPPPRILEVGCGTGLLTQVLRQRCPASVLHVLDPSPPMLDVCRRRLHPDVNIRPYAVDFLAFPETDRFPLIVSNAALHWIDPVESAAEKLGRLAEAGGRFVGSIMVEGTLAELHAARDEVAPGNRPAARLPTAERFDAALQAVGFRIHAARTEALTATYPDARDFLAAIHRTGVTAGPVSRGPRPLTRGELQRLIDHYNATYRRNASGVTATYVVHYVAATTPLAG